MKQFVFFILALVGMLMVLGLCSKSPTPPTTVTRSDPKPSVEKTADEKAADEKAASDWKLFNDHVMQELGPSPASWRAIRFEERRKDDISLTLLYQLVPSSLMQVENDTKRIARAALKVLMQDGRKPQQEGITLFVRAQMPTKGETGADLVQSSAKPSTTPITTNWNLNPVRQYSPANRVGIGRLLLPHLSSEQSILF